MNERPPELDMTLDGEFRTPPKPPLLARVMFWTVIVAVIAAAVAHAQGAGLRLRYRVATTDDLLGEGETFPVITALEVIEHVADLDAAIATARQLGGRLTAGPSPSLSSGRNSNTQGRIMSRSLRRHRTMDKVHNVFLYFLSIHMYRNKI